VLSAVLLSYCGQASIVPLAMRLAKSGCKTFVHLDAKASSPTSDYIAELEARGFVTVLPERMNCTWGGFSLVAATLAGMKECIKGSSEWTLVISDMHLPLTEIDDLKDFLSSVKQDAIFKYGPADMESNDLHEGGRFDHVYLETEGLGILRGPPRRPILEQMVIGTQFIAVRTARLRELWPQLEEQAEWYRESLIPDESFFQNIILSYLGKKSVWNTALVHLEWSGPALVEFADFDQVLAVRDKTEYFARKFVAIPRGFELTPEEREIIELADQRPAATTAPVLPPPETPLSVAEIANYCRDYHGREVRVRCRSDSSVSELRVFLWPREDLFLTVRSTRSATSVFLAGLARATEVPDELPNTCPIELRTPLIRYRSPYGGPPLYCLTHPASARLTEIQGSREAQRGFVKGWLDLYASAGSASVRAV